MSRAKRIFLVADFKDEFVRSMHLQSRMMLKGLVALGHDVQRFSYRNIQTQFNPFSGRHFRRFMPKFAKRHANELMACQLKAYYPDIVFVFTMKYLDEETMETIRRAAPQAVIVGRDEDPFPERNHARLAIAKACDCVLNTSAGRFLQTYKDAGVKRCAFLPNLCDPDIQHHYNVDPKWKADIIFTGKHKHARLGDVNDQRYELVEKLHSMPNMRVYGAFDAPRVEGLDYFFALSGATITLSMNIINDVELYHSDRLINSLACGAFVLAKRIPKTQLLYEDPKHLRYFESNEEFFGMVDYYHQHGDERQAIARAGMEFVHEHYNPRVMAQHALDLIEKGSCDAPWNTVLS